MVIIMKKNYKSNNFIMQQIKQKYVIYKYTNTAKKHKQTKNFFVMKG